ncbi:hypothetical protein [Parasphingorhabdus sp.]|uniref:hypothetical protein n=1 Tax=Parasphingorhabdus sp. TaxID=2709688 RepID=UPI003264F596
MKLSMTLATLIIGATLPIGYVAVAQSGGIVLADSVEIDDIGDLERANPEALRAQRARETRTCTCPVGTFEYFGMDCRSSKTYEIVTTRMGGYAKHKNCGATYSSPLGDGL